MIRPLLVYINFWSSKFAYEIIAVSVPKLINFETNQKKYVITVRMIRVKIAIKY